MESNVVPGLVEAATHAIHNDCWTPVRKLLQDSLAESSVEYQQLQEILVEHNIIEIACKRGFTELVSVFLNSGFPVNGVIEKPTTQMSGNSTMLHLAACNGHLSLVTLLINSGADVDYKSPDGSTSLHLSVYQNIEVVKVLLDAGAHVDGVDTDAWTPLQWAALFNNIPAMELLLEYGADINKRVKHGYTALHIAVANNRLQSVEFLIRHGCSINSVTENQDTPLLLSVMFKHFDMAMLLINSAADLDLEIHRHLLNRAVYRGAPVHLIQCLLERGADVTRVYNNKTAFQYVMYENSYEDWLMEADNVKLQVAKLLLIYGANHYVEDGNGNTALHWACRMGDVHLVKYLIHYGLSVDARNKDGEKPYDIAREKGFNDIVKVIIQHHCNKYTSFQ